MKRKADLKLSVAISIAAHAALIALIAWGAYQFLEAEFPGTNAVVGVWIEGPEGGEPGSGGGGGGGEGGAKKEIREKTPEKKTPQARVRETERKERGSMPAIATVGENVPSSAEKGAEGEGEGKGKFEGAGAGEGGTETGIGGGSGGKGNPVLAAIWRRINSHKYYPGSARRRGIIGSPRVTFTINKDGSIGWIKLAASCGEAELDAAAIETVQRAAPLPYYAGAITLAVRYSLER